MLEDRLRRGVELYEAGVSEKLLMSGDHGTKGYDEVGAMKAYATEREIPSQNVFMDHAGFSTYESMYRAAEVFEADKIVIVTQKYHLYRAVYAARALGLDAYGVAADYRSYSGQIMRDIREVLARCKDFAICILQPEPTFLGDVIPVSGNGDVTNDSLA
jgi:vancomycin permeability regulator SanA